MFEDSRPAALNDSGDLDPWGPFRVERLSERVTLFKQMRDSSVPVLLSAPACGAMQQDDIEQKSRAIDNALRIIGEGLRAGLNLKDGGPLARDLNDLYGYIELRLTLANLRNDSQSLVECSALVKTLADAWREIGPQVRQAG